MRPFSEVEWPGTLSKIKKTLKVKLFYWHNFSTPGEKYEANHSSKNILEHFDFDRQINDKFPPLKVLVLNIRQINIFFY